MPKMTNRRGTKGEMIYEPDDNDSTSKVEVEKGTKRALDTMVSGAKPKVSDEEPKDKNSIQYMVWKKRRDKVGKSMGL